MNVQRHGVGELVGAENLTGERHGPQAGVRGEGGQVERFRGEVEYGQNLHRRERRDRLPQVVVIAMAQESDSNDPVQGYPKRSQIRQLPCAHGQGQRRLIRQL